MNKLISIKDARLKKGITIQDLSHALKLDVSIVHSIEEDQELPNKYKSYRSTYERSIYKYLGYSLPNSNNFQNNHSDYSKIVLISFFLLFSVTILFFSSLNIYFKYNKNLESKIFEKDEIYKEINNFISQEKLKIISHKDFLNLLSVKNRGNVTNKFVLYVNDSSPMYFKVKNIDQKTIEFGELLRLSKIEFDLKNDFLIDLSNIANIDKIIFRGVEIKLRNNYEFYIKDFNIKKLEEII